MPARQRQVASLRPKPKVHGKLDYPTPWPSLPADGEPAWMRASGAEPVDKAAGRCLRGAAGTI